MNRKNLHERYHSAGKLQKKVIDKNNFTYRNLIRLVEKYSKGRKNFLDIGCGVGTTDFYLAKKGKKVTGIDISTNAINLAIANSKYLKLDRNLKFIALDFPKQKIRHKYDLIIASEVLEHLENDKVALQEIHKMLKSTGILVLSSPSKNAPLYKLGILKKFDKRVGHLRRYTAAGLKKSLRETGYSILEINKTEGIFRNFLYTHKLAGFFIKFFKFWIADFVSLIDDITIPIFGESQIYLVARKK